MTGMSESTQPDNHGQSAETVASYRTPEYHKARRQLALFAGLLLAWEFIGIRLLNKQ